MRSVLGSEDREISQNREVEMMFTPTALSQKWHWHNYLKRVCPESTFHNASLRLLATIAGSQQIKMDLAIHEAVTICSFSHDSYDA